MDFLEANPLARYCVCNSIDNNYFRICLNSVYHSKSSI